MKGTIESLVDDVVLSPFIDAANGKVVIEIKGKEYQLQFSFGADRPNQAGVQMERVIMTFNMNNTAFNAVYFTVPEKKFRGDIVAGIKRVAQYIVSAAINSSDKKLLDYWDDKYRAAIEQYYGQVPDVQPEPVE